MAYSEQEKLLSRVQLRASVSWAEAHVREASSACSVCDCWVAMEVHPNRDTTHTKLQYRQSRIKAMHPECDHHSCVCPMSSTRSIAATQNRDTTHTNIQYHQCGVTALHHDVNRHGSICPMYSTRNIATTCPHMNPCHSRSEYFT